MIICNRRLRPGRRENIDIMLGRDVWVCCDWMIKRDLKPGDTNSSFTKRILFMAVHLFCQFFTISHSGIAGLLLEVCVCRSKVMRLKWRFYVIVSRRCCCLLRFIMPSSKKLNAITVIFSAIFLAFSFKIMNNVVIDLSRSIKFLVYAHSFSLFVLLSFVHAYLLLTNQKKLNSEFRRNKILIKFHFYIFSHSS